MAWIDARIVDLIQDCTEIIPERSITTGTVHRLDAMRMGRKNNLFMLCALTVVEGSI